MLSPICLAACATRVSLLSLSETMVSYAGERVTPKIRALGPDFGGYKGATGVIDT
jgi:hypothetical protein